MEECQGLLTISATKESNPEPAYQYRGIAARSFSKTFRIAEFFEVSNATLEDGILTVSFIRNIPEEAKPKLIAIK
jgi:molecular chaperone IbpA